MATQTLAQEIEAGALNAIAVAIQANSAAVESFISSGEVDIEAGLANLIKNIPTVKGILALAVGPIEAAVETGVEAYVASLLTKYTPAQIVTIIVTFLQAQAAKV